MPTFPDSLTMEFLFDAQIDLEAPEAFGPTPYGQRSVHIVTGGTFEGPRLRGTFRAGGGDWFVTLANGAGELDVRVTMRTDDGALILLTYRGVLDVTPAVVRRVFGREDVGASEYYFRTTPRFETSAEKYAWLNRLVCVGTGYFGPQKVGYRIFGVR